MDYPVVIIMLTYTPPSKLRSLFPSEVYKKRHFLCSWVSVGPSTLASSFVGGHQLKYWPLPVIVSALLPNPKRRLFQTSTSWELPPPHILEGASSMVSCLMVSQCVICASLMMWCGAFFHLCSSIVSLSFLVRCLLASLVQFILFTCWFQSSLCTLGNSTWSDKSYTSAFSQSVDSFF